MAQGSLLEISYTQESLDCRGLIAPNSERNKKPNVALQYFFIL